MIIQNVIIMIEEKETEKLLTKECDDDVKKNSGFVDASLCILKRF